MRDDLEKRFASNPSGSAERDDLHNRVRKEFRDLAELVTSFLRDAPREEAIVFKALEDAMMWTNMGIARSFGRADVPPPVPDSRKPKTVPVRGGVSVKWSTPDA